MKALVWLRAMSAAILFCTWASGTPAQNTPVNVWNVKAPPFSAVGDGSANDAPAFQRAIAACNLLPSRHCTIHIPQGNYSLEAPLLIPEGAAISFVGDHQQVSQLIAKGFTAEQSVLTYGDGGHCGVPLQTDIQTQMIEVRDLTISGNLPGAAGQGIRLNCVNKSVVDRVLFEWLTNGIVCKRSSTDTFSNMNTFSLKGTSIKLGTDCNNILVLGSAFGSAIHGIEVVGALHGLSVIGSNCESVYGYCISLTPLAGERVDGVSVQNSHFENVIGAALYVSGADANSVSNLKFDNNYVSGGYVEHRSDNPTYPQAASYALILRNVAGFEINNNVFYDWLVAAFTLDGTESNGSVEHNMLIQPSGAPLKLTSTTAIFRPSVRVTNNARWVIGPGTTPESIGRQEIFRATIPNAGNCNVGDIAWNTVPASGGYAGWVCVVAGTPGTWKKFGLIQ